MRDPEPEPAEGSVAREGHLRGGGCLSARTIIDGAEFRLFDGYRDPVVERSDSWPGAAWSSPGQASARLLRFATALRVTRRRALDARSPTIPPPRWVSSVPVPIPSRSRCARRATSTEVTGTSKGVYIDVERATALGTMLGVHRMRHELLVGTALTLMAAVAGEAASREDLVRLSYERLAIPERGSRPAPPLEALVLRASTGEEIALCMEHFCDPKLALSPIHVVCYCVYAVAGDFGATAARAWLRHVASDVSIDPQLVRRMGDVVRKAGGTTPTPRGEANAH